MTGWAGRVLSIKVRDLGGPGRPRPIDKSEGLGGPGWPGPVDKSEGLGRARQAQPIEVRAFGVTGPGPAVPPSLANPHLVNIPELSINPSIFGLTCAAEVAKPTLHNTLDPHEESTTTRAQ